MHGRGEDSATGQHTEAVGTPVLKQSAELSQLAGRPAGNRRLSGGAGGHLTRPLSVWERKPARAGLGGKACEESSRGRISVYGLADGGIHANTKETVYFIK